jgi:hypothetical protein
MNLIPEERRIDDIDGWLRTRGLGAPPTSVHLEEEAARLRAEEEYAQSIHQRIFHEKDAMEQKQREERAAMIQQWAGLTIHIRTQEGVLEGVSLTTLASSCDTVFALASSWNSFATTSEKDEMYFSLEQFSKDSVEDFLALVDQTKKIDTVSENNIVDCCQIAHYLQSESVLQSTVEVLLESVSSANCLSMYQLADQLHLHQLSERALGHMMETLGDEHFLEAWEDLTPELKDRIETIRMAIQTSANSRTSRLFFGSLDEYISIFSERVQYFRERLIEAQEQLQLIEHGTRSWEDTFQKVQRQEARVRTLQRVLAEQKKMFRSKGIRIR